MRSLKFQQQARCPKCVAQFLRQVLRAGIAAGVRKDLIDLCVCGLKQGDPALTRQHVPKAGLL